MESRHGARWIVPTPQGTQSGTRECSRGRLRCAVTMRDSWNVPAVALGVIAMIAAPGCDKREDRSAPPPTPIEAPPYQMVGKVIVSTTGPDANWWCFEEDETCFAIRVECDQMRQKTVDNAVAEINRRGGVTTSEDAVIARAVDRYVGTPCVGREHAACRSYANKMDGHPIRGCFASLTKCADWK